MTTAPEGTDVRLGSWGRCDLDLTGPVTCDLWFDETARGRIGFLRGRFTTFGISLSNDDGTPPLTDLPQVPGREESFTVAEALQLLRDCRAQTEHEQRHGYRAEESAAVNTRRCQALERAYTLHGPARVAALTLLEHGFDGEPDALEAAATAACRAAATS